MRIHIHDIEESPKELLCEESTDDLNQLLEHGPVHDYKFAGPAAMYVRYYRAGQELFFGGKAVSAVVGECARCLEHFTFNLEVPFSFVLVPRAHLDSAPALEAEDVNLSYYHGHEVDLSPLVREQVILALPTQALCTEACRGLCPQCGTNLNLSPCECKPQSGVRFAVLRNHRART